MRPVLIHGKTLPEPTTYLKKKKVQAIKYRIEQCISLHAVEDFNSHLRFIGDMFPPFSPMLLSCTLSGTWLSACDVPCIETNFVMVDSSVVFPFPFTESRNKITGGISMQRIITYATKYSSLGFHDILSYATKYSSLGFNNILSYAPKYSSRDSMIDILSYAPKYSSRDSMISYLMPPNILPGIP